MGKLFIKVNVKDQKIISKFVVHSFRCRWLQRMLISNRLPEKGLPSTLRGSEKGMQGPPSRRIRRIKVSFFTPLSISEFMGRLAAYSGNKDVSILDPGCGLAILSCALIEHIVQEIVPEHISLTLYETDKKVVPLTEDVLSYLKTWCGDRKVKLDYQLNESDFVLEKCECLDGTDTIFGDLSGTEKFDYIISNPPYFKLAKDDIHTRSCASIVDGQTNIYALFMAICAKLVAEDGQMIFITPRSFASGRYFQSFRDFLFSTSALTLSTCSIPVRIRSPRMRCCRNWSLFGWFLPVMAS